MSASGQNQHRPPRAGASGSPQKAAVPAVGRGFRDGRQQRTSPVHRINFAGSELHAAAGKIPAGWSKGSGVVQRERHLKLKLVRKSRQIICCSRALLGLPKRGENVKIRAGSEFIRRISAMFIFSIRTVVLAVAVSASSLSGAATLSAQSELLCSPEGLMRLIPQFNVNGQFTIPNPNTDLQTFLSAHQGLSNAIDMILAQENISQNPSNVGSLPSRPLIFGSNWLSSEVGIQTDGTNLKSLESGGQFGGYRVQSFLTGLIPVPLSQGSIYVIKQSNPTYQALVYPMPTSHPCVNRLVLAADNTVGSWLTPTYALGRYQLDNNGLPMRDKPLITYLIVNICLDLGKSAVINRQSVLRPNAMIILALQWPCEGSGCANNGIGHQH
jgi:hypothetical protein